MKKFTWKDTYKELALNLCDYENRQEELIFILKSIGIDRFRDYDSEGKCNELTEIDPFTFFSYLNKYSDEKRVNILQQLHRKFSLKAEVPYDVEGLPTSHPMKVWLFGYKKDRGQDDISLLWKLFKQVLKKNINNHLLQKVLGIKGVGRGKLSICWFYTDPEYYIPLDSQTSRYLRDNGLKYVYYTIEEYNIINEAAKAKFDKPPYEISFDAWETKPKTSNKKKNKPQSYDQIAATWGDYINTWDSSPDGTIINLDDLFESVFDKSKMSDNNIRFYYRGQSSVCHELKPGVYRRESWIKNEQTICKEIENAVPQEFSSCKCTFDKLVKMQHYQSPTRLLDVTANPLVALYFACQEEKDNVDGCLFLFETQEESLFSKYSDSDAVSVVSNISRRPCDIEIDEINKKLISPNKENELDYLLHEIRCCDKPHFLPLIDIEDLERIFLVKPKMDNPRIVKQEGAFFLFGFNKKKTECLNLEANFPCSKYIIPHNAKKRLLEQLEIMGINEGSLFPEIDHIATYIKNKYS